MTDSLSSYKSAKSAENPTNSSSHITNRFIEPVVLIRRMALGIAIATWVVMAIGSATRVMNAGLACPDWPLCYGSVLPAEQMNLQVFLEWFHRLVASTVGFATIVLFSASWKRVNKTTLDWFNSRSFSLFTKYSRCISCISMGVTPMLCYSGYVYCFECTFDWCDPSYPC